MNSNLITFFCCPKAFKGHDAIIQQNALNNWKALGVDVILLGNDDGVAEKAKEYNFKYIEEIGRTEFGTPLLSDIFNKSQEAAVTPLVCYTNADILYPKSFLTVARLVAERFSQFLVIGQRWDLDIKSVLNFTEDWESVYQQMLCSGSVQHSPWAMDYFLFSKGLIKMPNFAIGRPGWDNWMVCDAKARRIAIIDASDAVPIIHQNHDYNHVPGRVAANWAGSPEALINRKILDASYPGYRWRNATVCAAGWYVDAYKKIKRNFTKKKISWDMETFRLVISGFNPLVYAKRFLKGVVGENAYNFMRKKWNSLF